MAAIRKSRDGDCNQWSGSPHSFRSNTPDWHAFGFWPDSRRYRKQRPHADLSDEASPDDRTMATRPAKSDTPTRRHADTPTRRYALLHPHLKLDLPAAVRSAVLHPELEVSEFGDNRIDNDRDRLTLGESFNRRQRHLDLTGLFEFAFGVRNDLTRCVPAADLRCEKAELRGLAGHQSELPPLDQ